jgi:hypothetical protein
MTESKIKSIKYEYHVILASEENVFTAMLLTLSSQLVVRLYICEYFALHISCYVAQVTYMQLFHDNMYNM